MSGIVLNLIVNLFMVVLLMVTITYCWVLNRRIKVLQDSKSELAQLLRYFDESTQRASDSIVALQSNSKKITETIDYKFNKASEILDDLEFMIEKGNKVANQIEAGLAVQRARHRMTQPPVSAAVQPEPKLESKPAAQPSVPVDTERKNFKEHTIPALESVLGRIAKRNKDVESQVEELVSEQLKKKISEDSPGRSQSEKELLAMLRSNMRA